MKYPGTGKLGQALKDFKLLVCRGDHNAWPEFWREFADQAFADLIALEVESKAQKKASKPRRKVRGENETKNI